MADAEACSPDFSRGAVLPRALPRASHGERRCKAAGMSPRAWCVIVTVSHGSTVACSEPGVA